MNKGFLNFIAVASFVASIATIVMTFLSTVIGLQVYIPTIQFGTYQLHIDFILLGLIVAGFYLFWQTVQALTSLADPWAESLAKIGSRLALGGFAIIFVLLLAQKSADVGNIAELVRTSYPFQLVGVLILIALIDVTFLQWLKHKLYGRYETIQGELVEDNDHRSVIHHDVSEARLTPRFATPLIGHADRVFYFDCRGKDIRVTPSATEGGDPTIEVTEPHAA